LVVGVRFALDFGWGLEEDPAEVMKEKMEAFFFTLDSVVDQLMNQHVTKWGLSALSVFEFQL
jgi:hypothetical protein